MIFQYLMCSIYVFIITAIVKIAVDDLDLFVWNKQKIQNSFYNSFKISSATGFQSNYGFSQVIIILIALYFSILFTYQAIVEKTSISISDLLIVEAILGTLQFYKMINRLESSESIIKEWKEILSLLVLVIFPVNQLPVKEFVITGFILMILLRRQNKIAEMNFKDLGTNLREVLFIIVACSHISKYFGISIFIITPVLLLIISLVRMLLFKEEEVFILLENIYLFTSLIIIGLLRFL